MPPELYRLHAQLARELLGAYSTLDEASRHCSLQKSRLQEFKDPRKSAVMTWQVIHELEEGAGRQGVYAAAMADVLGSDAGPSSMQDEACDLSETILRIQGLVRKVKGIATEAQKEEACRLLLASEQHLRRLHHDIERGDP